MTTASSSGVIQVAFDEGGWARGWRGGRARQGEVDSISDFLNIEELLRRRGRLGTGNGRAKEAHFEHGGSGHHAPERAVKEVASRMMSVWSMRMRVHYLSPFKAFTCATAADASPARL